MFQLYERPLAHQDTCAFSHRPNDAYYGWETNRDLLGIDVRFDFLIRWSTIFFVSQADSSSIYACNRILPMSRFMISDLDMGMGCCGCLGFFKKPERDVDFEKFSILDRGRFRKVATLTPGKNRAICRGMPVKETKLLTQTQVSYDDSVLMIFFFLFLLRSRMICCRIRFVILKMVNSLVVVFTGCF